ncbi:MAG: anti-sigma factor [Bacteroidota bacterium]
MDIKEYISSGILEQYVLGLCTPKEADKVEQYAEQHPEVQQKIKKLQSCMEHYADLHAIPPPPKLKNRILGKIHHLEDCKGLSVEYKRGQTLEQSPVVPQDNFRRLWSGIAVLMIFSLGFLSYSLYEQQKLANQKLAGLYSEIQYIKADYRELRVQSDQLQAQYAVLKDAGTRYVHLRGSNMAPQSLAVIYYNPDHKKTYLNVVRLPDPPSGHQYQLWADIDGKHYNMGAVKVNDDGSENLHTMPFLENSRGFAITLEEQGQSKVPTVAKMCLSGSL